MWLDTDPQLQFYGCIKEQSETDFDDVSVSAMSMKLLIFLIIYESSLAINISISRHVNGAVLIKVHSQPEITNCYSRKLLTRYRLMPGCTLEKILYNFL